MVIFRDVLASLILSLVILFFLFPILLAPPTAVSKALPPGLYQQVNTHHPMSLNPSPVSHFYLFILLFSEALHLCFVY